MDHNGSQWTIEDVEVVQGIQSVVALGAQSKCALYVSTEEGSSCRRQMNSSS